MSVKSDFASLYSQWESLHDEKKAIAVKARQDIPEEKSPQISARELHRMKVQDELDLHSFTVDEAVSQAGIFIESCHKKCLRKIRLITGKGLHSPNGKALIRPEIIQLVKTNRYISEYDLNPKPADGGTGAVIVYLKK